ncbi:glycosyltransferase family 39 protein [uncultured Cytophaga sp.]|mgnify:FL=1|uniref:glycosyltransferase family 39 protein n=1 Tax=uncultured Cytophaga sp. TaxID=160238 RepID=UPI0026196F74|nr:glycosyltransferase family 39 protein [uncultured Cytophaga sp.]
MKKYSIIFISFFIVRIIFSFLIGFYNNYSLQPDSIYLIQFADNAVKGDFNFDFGRFITSPVFPCFAALLKISFGQYWNTSLILFQIILSSISGIFIYKISNILFNNSLTAAISTIIYCFFPMTFWYVNTFSQETLFQSLFIITIYYLIDAYKNENIKSLIFSAVFFSLTYLTKSHILLFSLFVPLLFFITLKSFKKSLLYTSIFASIALICSLPYGLYHLKKNNTYVLSSNGSGFQFYLGNTNAGYKSIVDIPKKTSSDYTKIKDITNTAGYFNGDETRFDSIISLTQDKKQKIFFADAFLWIRSHPKDILKLKLYDFIIYLMPGVSYRHYPILEWAFSFLISFPIYLFAYLGLYKSCTQNHREHFFMIAIFLTMILFSTVFYVQNRFRTITIEPFYILYAGYFIQAVLMKYFPSFTKKCTNPTLSSL